MMKMLHIAKGGMIAVQRHVRSRPVVIGLAVVTLILLSGFLFMLPVPQQEAQVPYYPSLARIEHKPVVRYLTPAQLDELFLPEELDEDVLWLARAIYSETKRPEEMELVAWVIRNRVDTCYRGKCTYKEVVLDPYQFSAFNPDSPLRRYYMSLTPESKAPGWETALKIAYYVVHADSTQRPFSIRTRHFYSERSMRWRMRPRWATAGREVALRDRVIDKARFRFYEDVI